MTQRRKANLLVLVGSLLLSAAGGLVYLPAGMAIAGAAAVLSGLFLVDVEGVREPRAVPPIRPRS